MANITYFDVDEDTILFVLIWYLVWGACSFFLNLITIYLIIFQSPFFGRETKYLFLNLQIWSLLANLHHTFLFAPYFYPRTGGAFCKGVLCLFVPFHYPMSIFVLLTASAAGAYVCLLLGRQQALILKPSKLHISAKSRYVVYGFIHGTMLTLALTWFTYDPDREYMHKVLTKEVTFFDWPERSLNWVKYNNMSNPTGACLFLYMFTFCFAVFGGLSIFLFGYTIYIVLKIREGKSRHKILSRRVRITITVLLQTGVSLLLFSVPCIVMIVAGLVKYTLLNLKIVILSQVLLATAAPLNAVVFLTGSRTYVALFKNCTLRKPLIIRSLSN